MCALNSKSYLLEDEETGKIKKAHKGVSHVHTNLNFEDYLQVIRKRKPVKGENKGFRFHDNEMLVYKQSKNALSYPFCKRIVLSSDSATTIPLNI